jgi:hypothetical protein
MTQDTLNKRILLGAFEQELKTYKKAQAKRDPTLAQDAMSWHINKQMIGWLEVHIDMIREGSYG